MPDAIPTAQERRFIAALAEVPERTVLRAYRDTAHCQPSRVARVRHAALELNIAPPPKLPQEGL